MFSQENSKIETINKTPKHPLIKNKITQNICNSWVTKKQNSDVYICSKCKFITLLRDNTSFECSICKDSSFITTASLFEKNNFLYIKSFNMDFVTLHDSKSWGVEAFLEVPVFYDDKLEFKNIRVGFLFISYYGKTYFEIDESFVKSKKIISKEKIYSFDEFIYISLSKKLIEYISDNSQKPKDISWLIDNKEFQAQEIQTQMKMLKFFLKHPTLKKIDFFYWKSFYIFYKFYKKNAKNAFATKDEIIDILHFIIDYNSSKALKKALYLSYEQSIKNKLYNPYVDYIFARYFKDINYLRELISIDAKVKNYLFSNSSYIKILFAIYKNPKKVKNYFTSLTYEHIRDKTFRDTYDMLKKDNFYHYIQQNSFKLPTNPTKLHDEVVKIYNKVSSALLKNKTFFYQQYQTDSITEYRGLTFILPYNKLELLQYAQILSNCAYSYADRIQNGYSIIYFVVKEKKHLHYAIEIKDQAIIQAKAKYNEEIPQEDLSIITQWFNNIYLDNMLRYLRKEL